MGDRNRELLDNFRYISQLFQQEIPDITLAASAFGVTSFMSNYNGCELFRVMVVRNGFGNFENRFALRMDKKTPKWLNGFTEKNAKTFVDRSIKYLKKQPLVSMHLSVYETKQRFEAPLQIIAKRKGLEVSPEVMVFMLADKP